ncbi:MAG: protein-L-isoaspartate(D-aspartate) O-methyltransferase [Chloroflexi bacterium]|nr:protein-L-isoaspartate(D-aspartate) O-methyltransferase [Chloroflexota bacterium]
MFRRPTFRHRKRKRSDRRNGAAGDAARTHTEAREEMVRFVSREVRDRRVLDAMRTVPRHEFVPPDLRGFAYEDSALPIGRDQTISQPLIVGLMPEAAALAGPDGGERVLELGAGSGYQAAVLAHLAAEVVTVERIEELRIAAAQRLAQLGLRNVRCLAAGERLGAPDEGPFDAILVTAAAPSIPPGLVAQLAERGRLVIPVGDRLGQELLVVTKRGGRVRQRSLGGCRFVPLIGDEAFPEHAAW